MLVVVRLYAAAACSPNSLRFLQMKAYFERYCWPPATNFNVNNFQAPPAVVQENYCRNDRLISILRASLPDNHF